MSSIKELYIGKERTMKSDGGYNWGDDLRLRHPKIIYYPPVGWKGIVKEVPENFIKHYKNCFQFENWWDGSGNITWHINKLEFSKK